jgi:hypothetical protein
MGDTDPVSDEIVRFFEALPADARAEYEKLADRDRRWGEDVEAERRDSGDEGTTGSGDGSS